MTNEEIEKQMWVLVKDERRILNELLVLINMAEERKLFLQRGYSSLFDWLVKCFGYSESAAYRRMQAARLLRAVPEVSTKIETGEVNLTTLAKAQTAIRAVEKQTRRKLTNAAKSDVVQKIENKSSVETDRLLSSVFPEIQSSVSSERVTALNNETSRVAANFPNKTLAKLERVKQVLSHSTPEGNLWEVVDYLADYFLGKADPLEKKTHSHVRPSTSAAVSHHDGGHRSKRTAVIQKAGGRCEWTDPKTGKRCESRYQPEVDHIMPKAFGGTDVIENLRCLCKSHNLMMAERNLGVGKANAWRIGKEGGE